MLQLLSEQDGIQQSATYLRENMNIYSLKMMEREWERYKTHVFVDTQHVNADTYPTYPSMSRVGVKFSQQQARVSRCSLAGRGASDIYKVGDEKCAVQLLGVLPSALGPI